MRIFPPAKRLSPSFLPGALLLFAALLVFSGCTARRPVGRPRVTPTPRGMPRETLTPSPTFRRYVTATPSATPTPTLTPTITPTPLLADPFSAIADLCWVAYQPSGAGSAASIEADLNVLSAAGVGGILTERVDSPTQLAVVAAAAQQEHGIVVEVWDPANAVELQNAISVARYPAVLGYVVGSGGLNTRYSFDTLQAAVEQLRAATGRPVAASEDWASYTDPRLLELGDWLFPSARAYAAGLTAPGDAVDFTVRTYDYFTSLAGRGPARGGLPGRPVILREVGLPSAGDEISPQGQAEFYRSLNTTRARFIYYTAFDQPGSGPDAHWGFFNADRSPKPAVQALCRTQAMVEATAQTPFSIYSDAGAPGNHFSPSGFQGDTRDIDLNLGWTTNPHSGSTAIQVTYKRLGVGPMTCVVTKAPCRYSEVDWLQPAGNWGTIPNAGYNLSPYGHITFWARASRPTTAEVGAGSIAGRTPPGGILGSDNPVGKYKPAPYPDSAAARYPHMVMQVNTAWHKYSLSLQSCGASQCAPLTYVINGFYLKLRNDPKMPTGPLIIYLDDIQYEQ